MTAEGGRKHIPSEGERYFAFLLRKENKEEGRRPERGGRNKKGITIDPLFQWEWGG